MGRCGRVGGVVLHQVWCDHHSYLLLQLAVLEAESVGGWRHACCIGALHVLAAMHYVLLHTGSNTTPDGFEITEEGFQVHGTCRGRSWRGRGRQACSR